jgi:Tfp pilus assembly protein PilZ
MDERRRQERFQEVYPAEVRLRDGEALLGLVADISSGGMLLRADEPCTPGEDLALTVLLPYHDRDERALPFEARVSWCEPDIAPGTHVIGLTYHGRTSPDGPFAMDLIRLLKNVG